jgi:hypothetical protein
MTTNHFDASLIEEVGAALTIAGTLLLRPLVRSRYAVWGATPDEVRMPMPCDELIASPRLTSTRAITIQAPANEVWAWMVQIGQGRGGLYSYERLENLAGCQMHNANQILPELQDLKIGDVVRLGPEGYPAFDVIAVQPPCVLALWGGPDVIHHPELRGLTSGSDVPVLWSWVFQLFPQGPGATRLVVRARLDFPEGFGNTMMWKVATDPMHFNMERQMLRGLKKRAEYSARQN